MKLSENYLMIAVAGIAVIFIVYAILKSVINFSVDPVLEKNAANVMFFLAAAIFLYGRSLRKKAQSENKNKTEK